MSVHVTSVGMLLVVWRPQPWFPSTSNVPYRSNNVGRGRTGMSKLALQGLQMLFAPLRLCYRCWCRWSCPALCAFLEMIVKWLWSGGVAILLGFAYSHRKIVMAVHRLNYGPTAPAVPMTELRSIRVSGGAGTSVLERILTMDDLFFQLVGQIHAVDLIRVSMASTACRRAVQQHWFSQACQKSLCFDSAERCFGCDMPICNLYHHKPHCGYSMITTLPATVWQVARLQAVCSKCYFLNLCTPRDTFRRLDTKCKGPWNDHDQADITFTMKLCSFCERLRELGRDKPKVYTLRGMRAYRQGKLSLMQYDPAVCSSCGAGLSAWSLRWWRCSMCSLERREDISVYPINERWIQLKATLTRRFTQTKDG